jgi:hypothetical protein
VTLATKFASFRRQTKSSIVGALACFHGGRHAFAESSHAFSIYKAYGYCFKTSKAINYFGNAGCSYDNEGDIPLSHADRSTILAIKKTEQSLGYL